jgi:hypothetical protein
LELKLEFWLSFSEIINCSIRDKDFNSELKGSLNAPSLEVMPRVVFSSPKDGLRTLLKISLPKIL